MRTFFSFSDAWKWLESVEISRFDMICWDLTWARPWAVSGSHGSKVRTSFRASAAGFGSKQTASWQQLSTSVPWNLEPLKRGGHFKCILWHFFAPKEINESKLCYILHHFALWSLIPSSRKAPLALPSHGSVASTLDFLARAQQRLVDGQNRQSLATQDRWLIFSLGMSNIRSFRICARSSMCFIHISRFMFMFANKCSIIFSILSCSILFFPDSAPCSSGAPTSWKSHQSVFAFNHFRSVLVWTCSRSLPKGQASPASPSHLPDFGSPAQSLANSLSVSCR